MARPGGLARGDWIADNLDMAEEREISRRGAILMGAFVSLIGLGIIAVSVFAPDSKFGAPRWVVWSIGGAFACFGIWMTVIYALGFDPKRPDETLPSPGIQLAVFIPGMLLFAAPFHWVAFWPGERTFATTLSLPFLAVHGTSKGLGGRIAFGAGCVLIDCIILAMVVTLTRRILRSKPDS